MDGFKELVKTPWSYKLHIESSLTLLNLQIHKNSHSPFISASIL